jgi:sugar lactone lactonase YvrE
MKTRVIFFLSFLSLLLTRASFGQTAASGYAVTTVVTGFASQSYGVGPTGLALDTAGSLYVSECYCVGSSPTEGIYKFSSVGGIASAATELATASSLGGVPWGLAFGKDGNLYAALVDAGEVVQVDTATGAVVRVVATGIFTASELATDPLSGDLFVDQSGGASNIYRVSPTLGTVTLYATVPNAEGLAFAPDGTLYAASLSMQELVKISGTSSPPSTPATWKVIASVPLIAGIAVSATPGTPFLYASRSFSGDVTKVDLTTSPPTLTDVVTGGSFGVNLAVGPDGSLYATQSKSIIRITNADGTSMPPPLGPLYPTNPNPPQHHGVFVDIKPQSCPNPINVGANGTLPVAILGTSDFDVTTVDPSSMKLQGVSPLRYAVEDVATPFTGELLSATSCTTDGGDGFTDLVLFFDKQAVSAALGTVTNGQVLVLTLTGNLLPGFGGTAISGQDVVVINK